MFRMEPRGLFHLDPVAGSFSVTFPTQKYQQPHEWLPDIRSNMPGGADPQAVNAIILDNKSNPTVVHFDDAAVISVDAHQGNLVVYSCSPPNQLHNMSDIVSGAVISVGFDGYPCPKHTQDPWISTMKVGGGRGERWYYDISIVRIGHIDSGWHTLIEP